MALVECHDCEKEISTEAKACPHCGATNKNRETSKTRKFLILIIFIGLSYGFYLLYISKLNPIIPDCTSYRGEIIFKRTFENGPDAQRNKLQVLDVTDQKVVATGPNPEDQVCEVTFRLNSGTKLKSIVTFERHESGSYFVRIKRK